MSINLCGDCGWLGSEAELYNSGTNNIKPELKVIIERNSLSVKCCPLCKSTFILSKPSFDFAVTNKAEVIPWIPNYSSRMPLEETTKMSVNVPENVEGEESEDEDIAALEADIDADIVAGILEEASETEREQLAQSLADGQSQATKDVIVVSSGVFVNKLIDKPKKKTKKKVDPKRQAVSNKPNRKCDDCHKRFYSKNKTNRCPECYESFMARFV